MASDAEMVRDPWREAIERWFIGWHRLPDWNAAPWPQINAMIAWEQSVALDPEVSEKTRALIAAARAEGMEAAAAEGGHLAKALRRVRNSRDWEDALKIAKNALARHEKAETARRMKKVAAAIRGGSHGG